MTKEEITLVFQVCAAFIGVIFLALAVWHYNRPRITVVKLQVALLGLAKPFHKELNEIAEKVEASNQRWYKFILTETVSSLSRHNDCYVSSSLSVRNKLMSKLERIHGRTISIKLLLRRGANLMKKRFATSMGSRGRKNTLKNQMASETNI